MSSKIFFPSSPTPLQYADGYLDANDGASTSISTSDMRSTMEKHCPTLFKKFKTPWWLKNGDLQTIYCVKGSFRHDDRVMYNRVHIGLVDEGTLGLDFTPVEHEDTLPKDTPIVIVLPGLTGGSHEPYVRALMTAACAPVDQGGLGYRGVVVHCRGCAGVPITSQRWYSGGNTEDFRQAVMYLRHEYPNARMMGVGFSVGSNILIRYLAEEGEHSPIASGCGLACPWDLIENEKALTKTMLGKYAYSRAMGDNLMGLLRRNAEALCAGSDQFVTACVENTLALKRPRLQDFDRTINSKAGGGAPFPFDRVEDYYTWASSHTALPEVKTPLVIINAADDPIVQKLPTTGDNPHVVMVVTPKGGHLGWFEKKKGWMKARRWFVKPVTEWLKLTGEGLMIESRGKEVSVDEAGWVRRADWPALGCKVVPGGGIVDGVAHDDLFQGL